MARLSQEKINEIRQSVDIVDVIGQYLSLEKKGRNYRAVCPFHDDHDPSMVISPEKQIYHCFVCNAGGNVFTFLQNYLKISYIEAVKKVAEIGRVDLSAYHLDYQPVPVKKEEAPLYEMHKEAQKIYSYYLNTKLGLEAKTYLLKRHFTEDLIKEFQIGYAPMESMLYEAFLKLGYKEIDMVKSGLVIESSRHYDRFIDRIMFPLYDLTGKVVGFSGRIYKPTQTDSKYVNSPESDIFIKGQTLYHYHQCKEAVRQAGFVYLLEGFMDVIALYRAGIYNAVAIMGTNISENHLNLFKKLGCEVRLLLDSDEPGQIGIEKSIFSLANYNIPTSVVRPFSLAKDSDELLNKYGSKVLIDALNDLISPINFLLERNGKLNLLVSSKQKEDFLNLIKPIYKCSDSLTKANDLSLISTNLHIEKDAISDILTSSNSVFNSVTNIKATNLNNKKSELIPNEYFSLNGEVCINLASYLEKKYVKQYPSKIKFKFLKALIFNEAQLIARIFKIRECYDYYISSKNSYSYFYISELSTLMLYIGEIYQQDSNLKNIDDSSFANLQTRLNLSMEEAINLNDSQQIGEYTNLINILNCLYYSKSNFDRCDFDNFARLIKNHIVNLNKFDIVNKRQ